MIACVLKSGGDFLPAHVYALQDMCARFLPGEEFICLTDLDLDCPTLELKGLGERYGYTDNDTINLLADIGYKIADRVNRDVIFTK